MLTHSICIAVMVVHATECVMHFQLNLMRACMHVGHGFASNPE